jgi:hypothetical protein
MNKKRTTSILVFCISAIALKSALSAGITEKTTLPDGFFLRGVEGRLFRQDANECSRGAGSHVWLFEFDSAVSDEQCRVDAGARLELLASSTLESMLADANDHSTASYELWARVTKYKDNNFIFPIYFLPLSKVKSPREISEAAISRGEPNELVIPQEIMDKLRSRRAVRLQQPERPGARKQNAVLTNRTGFISSCVIRDAYRVEKKTQNAKRKTQYVFILDALGRNIQPASGGLRLLPCQVLDLAEQIQSIEPDPIRFKIAGIVTEYKDQKYLLLQQATRVYSYGNFAK